MLYSRDELDALLMRLRGVGAVAVDLEKGFLLKHHENRPGAKRSPIKINLATPDVRPDGMLTPVDMRNVIRFMWKYSKEKSLRYSGVAGVPNAGNALAEAFVDTAYHDAGEVVSLLTLDKYEEGGKRHIGKLKKVSPTLPRGERVLLLDDVATKGESKEEAAEQLRAEGYEVHDCLMFVDREQGASASLELINLNLHAVTTLQNMVSLYHQRGFINDRELEIIRGYVLAE